jgi:hypothetical protein
MATRFAKPKLVNGIISKTKISAINQYGRFVTSLNREAIPNIPETAVV